MLVVSNTTPIISLSSVGKLSILKDLFGEVLISEAIYNEIKHYLYGLPKQTGKLIAATH